MDSKFVEVLIILVYALHQGNHTKGIHFRELYFCYIIENIFLNEYGYTKKKLGDSWQW